MDSTLQQKRYTPRRPGRLTITVSRTLLEELQHRADQEGRSVSNLAAVLLEIGMDRPQASAS
jgi:hypothetical protein